MVNKFGKSTVGVPPPGSRRPSTDHSPRAGPSGLDRRHPEVPLPRALCHWSVCLLLYSPMTRLHSHTPTDPLRSSALVDRFPRLDLFLAGRQQRHFDPRPCVSDGAGLGERVPRCRGGVGVKNMREWRPGDAHRAFRASIHGRVGRCWCDTAQEARCKARG